MIAAIDRFLLRLTGKPYTRFRATYAARLLLVPLQLPMLFLLAGLVECVDYVRGTVPYWWRIVNGRALK